MGEVEPADVTADRVVGTVLHGEVVMQEVPGQGAEKRVVELADVAAGGVGKAEGPVDGKPPEIASLDTFAAGAVPGGKGRRVVAEFRDQVLATGIDQASHQGQRQHLQHPGL